MPYIPFNNNPKNQRVGDCAVRAVSKALNKSWDDVYIGLCAEGLFYNDMPSANYVWGMYLRQHGFDRSILDVLLLCTSNHRRGWRNFLHPLLFWGLTNRYTVIQC